MKNNEYYRGSLSKTDTKKAQRAWASVDAMTIKRLLSYIFGSVKTQKGSTNARYPALAELKSMVKSPSVIRRSLELQMDLCMSTTIRHHLSMFGLT